MMRCAKRGMIIYSPGFEEIPIIGIFMKSNVMRRNTSVLLGDHFEGFIAQQLSSGKYASASEVVRTALRLLENEEEQKRLLNNALIEGEDSGFIDNFNPDTFLQQLNNKKA